MVLIEFRLIFLNILSISSRDIRVIVSSFVSGEDRTRLELPVFLKEVVDVHTSLEWCWQNSGQASCAIGSNR